MRLFKRIAETRKMLNRPIYTGERLEDNLKALSFAGGLFAVVGAGLAVYDFFIGESEKDTN